MNWTLEVVVVPVSDVDRAKSFYADQVGFNLDHDTRVSDEIRIVQLTPPGSGCSIVLGTGIVDSTPGSLRGLQLVVSDIEAARAELVQRGVEVTDIQRLDPSDGGTFVYFSDPDGNAWAVQEIRARA
ncbi:MAG: glyoxalase superfamily protein [Pseudonocardiaceae bacterium]